MPNRLKVRKIHRVSLVNRGDDPEAQVVLIKNDGGMGGDMGGDMSSDTGCPGPSNCSKRKKGERYCATCPLRNMSKEEVVTDDVFGNDTLDDTTANAEGANVSNDEFMLPDDTPAEVVEYIKSLEGHVIELEDALDTITAGGPEDGSEDDGSDNTDDLVKSAPLEIQALLKAQQEELDAARAAATEATEIAKAEREARMEREFFAKAESMPHLNSETSELASLLRKIADAAPEEFEALEALLTSANRAVADGELFKQASTAHSYAGGSAYEKVVAKAEEMRAIDPALSTAAAIAKVAETDSALYREYIAEKKER